MRTQFNSFMRVCLPVIILNLFISFVTHAQTILIMGNSNSAATPFCGSNGLRVTYIFPPNLTTSKTVYGTDCYTDDSPIASAAVHAGLITFEKGGKVVIEIQGSQPAFIASARNGVNTQGYASWACSYVFVRRPDQVITVRHDMVKGDWGMQAKVFRTEPGSIITYFFPPYTGALGDIYGTDIYSDDSPVAVAAVHAGLIKKETGGIVCIKILGSQDSYLSTTKNGVTSKSFGYFQGSYKFIVTGASGADPSIPGDTNQIPVTGIEPATGGGNTNPLAVVDSTDTRTENDTIPLLIICSKTNPSKPDASDGSAKVTVLSGYAPFAVYWSSVSYSPEITGLKKGIYKVAVMDSKGQKAYCWLELTDEAVKKTPLTILCSKTNPSSTDAHDGSAVVTIKGDPPFRVLWSNKSTTPQVTNLSNGIYKVAVVDKHGNLQVCEVKLDAENRIIPPTTPPIPKEPPIPNPITELTVTCSATKVKQIGDYEGTATAIARGTPPYEYAWSNYSTGATITGLGIGTYEVVVTDANKKKGQCTTMVLCECIIPPLSIKCKEFVTGTEPYKNTIIGVEIKGGVPLFKYQWSNGSTSGTLNNPPPDEYMATVTDGVGQIATCKIRYGNPANSLIVNCDKKDSQKGNDGEAWVTVGSGIPPYTYKWTNGASNKRITGLSAGEYSVTVTDQAGGTASCAVEIKAPAIPLLIECGKSDPNDDSPDLDGKVWVKVISGTPPYKVDWNMTNNNSSTLKVNDTISNLPAGSYTAKVTDASNQSVTCEVILNYPPKVTTCPPKEYLVANLLTGTDYLNVISSAIKEIIERDNSKLYEELIAGYAKAGWRCKYIGIALGIFEKTPLKTYTYKVLSGSLTNEEIKAELIGMKTTHYRLLDFSLPLTFEYDPDNTYNYWAMELEDDQPEDYAPNGIVMSILNEHGKLSWELGDIIGDLLVFMNRTGNEGIWTYSSYYTYNNVEAKNQVYSFGKVGSVPFAMPLIMNRKNYPNMVKTNNNNHPAMVYNCLLFHKETMSITSLFRKENNYVDKLSKELSDFINCRSKYGWEVKMGINTNGEKYLNSENYNFIFYVPEGCYPNAKNNKGK